MKSDVNGNLFILVIIEISFEIINNDYGVIIVIIDNYVDVKMIDVNGVKIWIGDKEVDCLDFIEV